ncbi:MAG: hypothetical protein AAF515_20725 [Pseudomonadota bacterium]
MNRLFVSLIAFALLGLSSVAFAGPGGVTGALHIWLRADTGVTNTAGMVRRWRDQSGNNNHAVHQTGFGELMPLLVNSNPNVAGRPTLRFNNNAALALDLRSLAGSDYTIFVVQGRDRAGLANFYIAGDSLATNGNLVLGYEQVALLRQAHFNNDLDATVPTYAGMPIWSIDTFRFSDDEGRTIYQDGAAIAMDGNLQPLVSNTGTTIGHFRAFGSAFFYQGDIAEIVVYTRALTERNRLKVEAELAARYGRQVYPESYVPCDGSYETNEDYLREFRRAARTLRRAGVLSGFQTRNAIAAARERDCAYGGM